MPALRAKAIWVMPSASHQSAIGNFVMRPSYPITPHISSCFRIFRGSGSPFEMAIVDPGGS